MMTPGARFLLVAYWWFGEAVDITPAPRDALGATGKDNTLGATGKVNILGAT